MSISIITIDGFTYEDQPVYEGRRLSIIGFDFAFFNDLLVKEAHQYYLGLGELYYDELTEEVPAATDAE